jgi:hypothetical protein
LDGFIHWPLIYLNVNIIFNGKRKLIGLNRVNERRKTMRKEGAKNICSIFLVAERMKREREGAKRRKTPGSVHSR